MARAKKKALPAAVPFTLPKRVSLADSIADSIAEAIATRHVLPGERIVEVTLAKRLGVSRVPIREALKVLQAQGILSGGGHRGYRVVSFEASTIQNVLEVRLMLEALLLRDAIVQWRNGGEDTSALESAITQMERSARAGDVKASLRADLAFHQAICRASHNPIAATLWEAIARHVLIIFNFDRYRDDDLTAVARQHEIFRDFILDQIKSPGSFEEQRKALEDHLFLVERTKRRGAA